MKKQVWVVRIWYGKDLVTCKTQYASREDAVKAVNICGYEPNRVIIARTR